MCFILIAHRVRPDLPVLVAANRDEYYERPTRAAGWWDRSPAVLAGRDERAGGTWFGVRVDGRFAAVTNLRLRGARAAGVRSRGELAIAALDHFGPLREFGKEIKRSGGSYGPFNLVFGDHQELYYYSNARDRHEELGPGVYALANGFLDAPWPKAVEGRRRFAALVRDTEPDVGALFDLLGDRRVHDDGLPDTGLPPERERALSAMFIEDRDYGTRCSTVYRLFADGRADFEERSHAGVFTGPTAAGFSFRADFAPAMKHATGLQS